MALMSHTAAEVATGQLRDVTWTDGPAELLRFGVAEKSSGICQDTSMFRRAKSTKRQLLL